MVWLLFIQIINLGEILCKMFRWTLKYTVFDILSICLSNLEALHTSRTISITHTFKLFKNRI